MLSLSAFTSPAQRLNDTELNAESRKETVKYRLNFGKAGATAFGDGLHHPAVGRSGGDDVIGAPEPLTLPDDGWLFGAAHARAKEVACEFGNVICP